MGQRKSAREPIFVRWYNKEVFLVPPNACKHHLILVHNL